MIVHESENCFPHEIGAETNKCLLVPKRELNRIESTTKKNHYKWENSPSGLFGFLPSYLAFGSSLIFYFSFYVCVNLHVMLTQYNPVITVSTH